MSPLKRSASSSPRPARLATTPSAKHPKGRSTFRSKAAPMGRTQKPGQRLGRIKQGAACDIVLLVLLDNRTLEPREMWEAAYADVAKRLAIPGSKARERGALGVTEFKRLARRVWPEV
jgi:hypothetical protein